MQLGVLPCPKVAGTRGRQVAAQFIPKISILPMRAIQKGTRSAFSTARNFL